MVFDHSHSKGTYIVLPLGGKHGVKATSRGIHAGTENLCGGSLPYPPLAHSCSSVRCLSACSNPKVMSVGLGTVCLSTPYTCFHLLHVVYVIVSSKRFSSVQPGAVLATCINGPGKRGKPDLASRLLFMVLHMWLVQTQKALPRFSIS